LDRHDDFSGELFGGVLVTEEGRSKHMRREGRLGAWAKSRGEREGRGKAVSRHQNVGVFKVQRRPIEFGRSAAADWPSWPSCCGQSVGPNAWVWWFNAADNHRQGLGLAKVDRYFHMENCPGHSDMKSA
jgi:hypothetical protein